MKLSSLLNQITCTCALGLCLVVGSASTSTAEILEFDVFGQIDAPLLWTKRGKWYQTGNTFKHDVNIGDLLFTYDTDTGVSKLTGTTTGCIADCTKAFDGTKAGRGEYTGSGQFAWDITMSNTLDKYTEDDGSKFGYNMQSGGTITLLNGNAPKVSTVMLKNDKDFAFRAFEVADGLYHTESWFQLNGGVVGGYSRFETGANNAALNWDLSLQLRDNTPEPPTEVPEPFTMSLLSAGLIGGLRLKKKSAK